MSRIAVMCALLTLFTCQAFCGEKMEVIVFDMNAFIAGVPEDTVLHYDALKAVASLQGVVNREEPRLLMRFLEGESASGAINIDDYWLEKMRARWLRDSEMVVLDSLAELFARFPAHTSRWALWDPAVPATANVASTMCGVEGLLPVRADSPLLRHLSDSGFEVKIDFSFVDMFDGSETGSAKCDAYLWAKKRYLETGMCHPALMAFFIDAYTQRPGQPGFHYPDLPNTKVANHDYYIANKAFFFDLSVWEDELPVDDPVQPLGADRAMLESLLKAQHARNGGELFTSIGGFVSWDLKYTNHGPAGGRREPVPTEWTYVALFTAYNAFIDADALGLACLPNASAYRLFPLQERYRQQPRPTPPPLEEKTYVLIYMGDYDSGAWLSRNIPRVWDDPARGEFPIAWAFNPNLSDRVPYVFDHIYETATANDFFIAGDSGAGYVHPNLLVGKRMGSGIPDALDLWVTHNQRYFEKFDYSITGFAINGFQGNMPFRIQEAYTRFSPDGVGLQLGFSRPLVGDTPFITHASDIYPRHQGLEDTADIMARFASPGKPQFLVYRFILETPTMVKNVMNTLSERHPEHEWTFPDPYSFFALYREHLRRNAKAE